MLQRPPICQCIVIVDCSVVTVLQYHGMAKRKYGTRKLTEFRHRDAVYKQFKHSYVMLLIRTWVPINLVPSSIVVFLLIWVNNIHKTSFMCVKSLCGASPSSATIRSTRPNQSITLCGASLMWCHYIVPAWRYQSLGVHPVSVNRCVPGSIVQ
jgi:hypothetical protein